MGIDCSGGDWLASERTFCATFCYLALSRNRNSVMQRESVGRSYPLLRGYVSDSCEMFVCFVVLSIGIET